MRTLKISKQTEYDPKVQKKKMSQIRKNEVIKMKRNRHTTIFSDLGWLESSFMAVKRALKKNIFLLGVFFVVNLPYMS